MAKLAVSVELLAQAIFNGAAPGVRISGASFDHARGAIVLDIDGPFVPDVPEVRAEFRVQQLTVEFKAVEPIKG